MWFHFGSESLWMTARLVDTHGLILYDRVMNGNILILRLILEFDNCFLPLAILEI